MSENLYTLWNTAFERFYCPKTNLFYEFVSDCKEKAWDRLPTVSDIKSAYPNPCGWGTGMEDAVMNGSNALDGLVAAYNLGVTGIKDTAKKLVKGILSCFFDDKSGGFVARSVSPIDGKSHYIESSRDQYTHFVYSLVKYYFSDLSDVEERDCIRKAIVAVAEKCKREVCPENDFNMLREDGSIGKVCKMWGNIGGHERMRLPMFYLAAFALTENKEYERLYKDYRDEALEKSLEFENEKSRLYCSLQMMLSLRFVYDFENDGGFKSKLLDYMKKVADYGEKKAISNSCEFSKPERKEQLHYIYKPWYEVNMRDGGDFGGYKYLNPGQSEIKENMAFYPAREVGEGAMIAAMCPERYAGDEILDALIKLAGAIDVKSFYSVYSLLYIPAAYAQCLENRKNMCAFNKRI